MDVWNKSIQLNVPNFGYEVSPDVHMQVDPYIPTGSMLPALSTRPSSWPHLSTASLTTPALSSGLLTSPCTGRTLSAPYSSTAPWSSGVRERESVATRALCFERRMRSTARPRPLDAPVRMMTGDILVRTGKYRSVLDATFVVAIGLVVFLTASLPPAAASRFLFLASSSCFHLPLIHLYIDSFHLTSLLALIYISHFRRLPASSL